MTLFEALKDFISVLKSHFVEGWMTYKSSIIQMSTTELTITWILEKEFILTMLNMKWAKPFAFLKANPWIEGIGNTYNFMIKVLSSDEQKTNKEEEETN